MRISLLAFFLSCLSASAQTGPGGVGSSSSNVLWLDANYGVVRSGSIVSQWSDRSGNGNHAVQGAAANRPQYSASAMNGYPSVLFDNDQTNPDRLTIPDNGTLEGMSSLCGFAVFKLNSGTAMAAPRGILSKRVDPSTQNAYGWFVWDNGGNLRQHLDINGTGDRLIGTTNLSTGTNYMSAFAYDGTAPSNAMDQSFQLFNSNDGNRQETSTTIPNYSSDLHIGSLYGHTGAGANTTRFNGDIAEVILYNTRVNSAQRIIVANYLAAKYGMTLGTADIYLQDNPGNGNFDHEVAGIGRVDASNMHTDARGGVVQVSKAGYGGLDDNEFLLWGHDNGALGAFGVTDKPTDVAGRWARVWRVSEVNAAGAGVNVGNTDVTFDLTGQGPVTAGDLCLLVDTDNDGFFADESPVTGATHIGGNLYRFTNINSLQNARRFTLGSSTTSTPLPIELISFTAREAAPSTVDLEWSTATERNNEHFTVERSENAQDWTALATVPGAGNSSTTLQYATTDRTAYGSVFYYRLRQTDTDGTSTTSDVVMVNMGSTKDEADYAYPNPFFGPFTVVLHGLEAVDRFEMIGADGRAHAVQHTVLGNGLFRIDPADLPPGRYVLRATVLDGAGVRSVNVVH